MALTTTAIKRLRNIQPPLSQEQLDAVLEVLETATLKKPKKGDAADRKERGTRLPADWVLPRSWGLDALEMGATEREIRTEAPRFKDFWLAKSGATAIKLDWRGTWRNWMRSTIERRGGTPRPLSDGPIDPKTPSGPTAISHETWAAVMRTYRRTNSWPLDLGPMPGRPGCRVPADLLTPLEASPA